MAFKTKVKSSNSNCKSDKIDEQLLRQMIQERAYYIWLERGKPTGQDLEIWLQAEKEIKNRFKK